MPAAYIPDRRQNFSVSKLANFLSELLREKMSKERYRHTIRVARTAKIYARRKGLSPDKAWLAGIMHDFAREWPSEQLMRFVLANDGAIRPDEREKPVLLHGRAAAIILEKTYRVTQPDILEAVEHHTLGRTGMSPLAKLLFVADYLEPGRKFTTLQYRRSVRNMCLDCMVCSVIQHCSNRHKDIHPLTAALFVESKKTCNCEPNRGYAA